MKLCSFGRSVSFVALAGVMMLPLTGAFQSSAYADPTLSQRTLNSSDESEYRFVGSFSSSSVVTGNDNEGRPFQFEILNSYVIPQADLLRWAEPEHRDDIEDSGVVARYVIGTLQTARGTVTIDGALYTFPNGTVAVRVSDELTDASERAKASLLFEFQTVSQANPTQPNYSWGCWAELQRWLTAAAAEELLYLAAAGICAPAPSSPACLAALAVALLATNEVSDRMQAYWDCMGW